MPLKICIYPNFILWSYLILQVTHIVFNFIILFSNNSMEQSFSFERDIAYSVRGTYNQNIKHRFFLVVFFCSPMILPLAIISNMIASSRKIVTIFQLYLALHSMCVERQVFFTNCAISFLLLDEDWLSIVCAAAKAVAAAAAPKITLYCIYLCYSLVTMKMIENLYPNYQGL